MKKTAQALILILLMLPGLARAQASPEESLTVVHGLLMQAVTSGSISTIGNLVHPQAVGFFRESQQLAQLRAGYGPSEVLPAVLTDLSQFSSTTYDTVFRVVGDTGIVSMTTMQDAKKSNVRDRYLRSTYVYTRVQDTWRLLSWHTSDTPLKR